MFYPNLYSPSVYYVQKYVSNIYFLRSPSPNGQMFLFFFSLPLCPLGIMGVLLGPKQGSTSGRPSVLRTNTVEVTPMFIMKSLFSFSTPTKFCNHT